MSGHASTAQHTWLPGAGTQLDKIAVNFRTASSHRSPPAEVQAGSPRSWVYIANHVLQYTDLEEPWVPVSTTDHRLVLGRILREKADT